MLLRLAYLAVTNLFALLRLLPVSDRDKDAEILALRHQITVLERQLGGNRARFSPADRAFLAALLHRLPRAVLDRFRLAREAGQGERARDLYEQSLVIAQALADDEPGNTTYRRDLSVSFNKLADLAREAGQGEEADQWVSMALAIRRQLVRDEPGCLDLAVELAYVLYLSTTTGTWPADDTGAAHEAATLLEPFQQLGHVTPRATALLAWAQRTL